MSGLSKFVVFLIATSIVTVSALWIIGGRPNTASIEVVIAARPEEVFSWLVDPGKRTMWVHNLEQTILETEEPEGRPEKFVSTFRFGDRTENHDETVLQHDAGQFLSLKDHSGGVQTTKVFRLEPAGKQVRLKYEIIQKANSLWKLKFAMQASDLEARIQTESLELKRLAEKNSEMPFLFGEPVHNPDQ